MDEAYHVGGAEAPILIPELHSQYLDMSNGALMDYLKEFFPEITLELWQQLDRLNEPAIEIQLKQLPGETVSDLEQTHLGYELEMVRIVLVYQEYIQAFLFRDTDEPIAFGEFKISKQDLIRRLVYMILLGDIGKAGPHLLEAHEDSPIMRIYNHVIVDGRHVAALKQHDFANGREKFDEAVRSNPDRYTQVHQAGNVGLAPIGLALQMAEQVFVETYPQGHEYHHYRKLFQLDEITKLALAELGFDSDETAMRVFWTGAHLYAAEQLFQSLPMTDDEFAAAIVSLLHHFSQGVVPKFLERVDIFQDSRTLELVALMEILDKADANYHRSHQKTPELVATTTEGMISANFQAQYEGNPQSEWPRITKAVDAYQRVVTFFQVNKIFQMFFINAGN